MEYQLCHVYFLHYCVFSLCNLFFCALSLGNLQRIIGKIGNNPKFDRIMGKKMGMRE